MFKKTFIQKIAKKECVKTAFLEEQLSKGRVVIPCNKQRKAQQPCAIGQGMKVKINTNIGLAPSIGDFESEIEKMLSAVGHGADTIMDLSVHETLVPFRKRILTDCPVPVGTVPIYEAAIMAESNKGSFESLAFKDMLEVLRKQAEEGVDFFTIHAGIVRAMLKKLKTKKRLGGVVSRGGALLTRWMMVNKKENPFYEHFDTLLELAKEFNVTISLGDALRPGSIFDSTDDLQISELRVLGTLVKLCRKKGVQVMVEGPGHIRLDEIALNMRLEKKICHNAPFYVLGPLPTDIAAGYDHITAAIGGAIGAFNGADFLCVVTPAEHLRHPSLEDIRDGTIASKIAAHSVNLLRFKDEWLRDYKLSKFRARRKWDAIFPLTLDAEKAKKYRENLHSSDDMCSMCGKFCSLKIIEKCGLLK